MFKNIAELLILFCLSTLLVYVVKLKQEDILKFWEYYTTDQQDLVTQQPLQKSTQTSVVKLTKSHRENKLQGHENVERHENFQCTTTPTEKVTVKKQTQIYRWRDDNGIVHFGDSNFQKNASQKVNLKRPRELEYFTLKMSGDNQPTQFNDELSTRITKIYQLLSDLIPTQKLDKVTVDLKIFNTKDGYRRYSRHLGKNLGNKTDGYYLMRYNQAVVYKHNEYQAGQVALHESTHVINAGIFGYIPRWLNEGIAEYTENMSVIGQAAHIQPNSSWIKHSRINTRRLVNFNELFSAKSSDWNSTKRRQYYATSWALIYFLMDSEDDKQWLGELLTQKAFKRCKHTINRDYIEDRYPGGIKNLQQRFNHWVRTEPQIATHRF